MHWARFMVCTIFIAATPTTFFYDYTHLWVCESRSSMIQTPLLPRNFQNGLGICSLIKWLVFQNGSDTKNLRIRYYFKNIEDMLLQLSNKLWRLAFIINVWHKIKANDIKRLVLHWYLYFKTAYMSAIAHCETYGLPIPIGTNKGRHMLLSSQNNSYIYHSIKIIQ